MRRWLPFISLVPLVLATGCGLYFGGDDDQCVAKDYAGPISNPLRDPDTGTCSSYESYCDPCSPCEAPPTPAPDLAQCESSCTGLDVASCEAMPGCYATFDEGPNTKSTYSGCWATAPSGPVEGTCTGLTARECARHDDCTLSYWRGAMPGFLRCEAEQFSSTCAAVDCAPGYHCEDQCVMGDAGASCKPACLPDVPSCGAIDCAPGYTCSNGQCVPVDQDPGSCTGFVACDANPPSCPSGTTPGVLNSCWSGYCIPNWACGPGDPGQCTGEVNCITGEPSCPEGTTAGIANGCWTGYCIPNSHCQAAACSTLTDESACTARTDCTAVYAGTNCTCTAGSCTCDNLTFQRCE